MGAQEENGVRVCAVVRDVVSSGPRVSLLFRPRCCFLLFAFPVLCLLLLGAEKGLVCISLAVPARLVGLREGFVAAQGRVIVGGRWLRLCVCWLRRLLVSSSSAA